MLLWSLYFLPAFLFKSLKTQGPASALPPGLSRKAIAVVPHGLLWLSAPTQQKAQGPQCGSQKLAENHWLSILLTGYFNLLWGWANNLSLPHFPDKLKGYTGVCSRLWKDEFFGGLMFYISILEEDSSFSHWPLPSQLCIEVKKPVKKYFLAPERDCIVLWRI